MGAFASERRYQNSQPLGGSFNGNVGLICEIMLKLWALLRRSGGIAFHSLLMALLADVGLFREIILKSWALVRRRGGIAFHGLFLCVHKGTSVNTRHRALLRKSRALFRKNRALFRKGYFPLCAQRNVSHQGKKVSQ